MSLFTHLELQPVEPDDASSTLDYYERDEINLMEEVDVDRLDSFLSEAVNDMHGDSLWDSLQTKE